MPAKSPSYRGCLLGLAAGDAMGYSADKKTWEEICRDYGPNGLLGYDLADGNADVTSYTQLAVFLTNGLLLGLFQKKPDTYAGYVSLAIREWVNSQQAHLNPEKTRCWVAQVPCLRRRLCMDTRMPDVLRRRIAGQPEYLIPSVTPGALTEAVGIALCADAGGMSEAQAGDLTARAIGLTHRDPKVWLSGICLCYALMRILRTPDASLPDVFTDTLDALTEAYPTHPEATGAIRDAVTRALTLTRDGALSPLVAMTMLECTDAVSCVAGAVYAACIHPGNFDEAMIVSVNHSGRSAAVAAITGAILGARLGEDGIPDFYTESPEVCPYLRQLGKDLSQPLPEDRIFDDSWDQKYVQGVPVLDGDI